MVASIDVRRDEAGQLTCFSHSGKRAVPGAIRWPGRASWPTAAPARSCSRRSIATAPCAGYDLELIAQVAGAVGIPVIASGGAGSYDDLIAAVGAGASAVAAASIFHFTEQTPAGAKEAMQAAGIPVRQRLSHPVVA